jgi:hypothetical protein
MVQAGVIQDLHHRTDGTSLGVIRAVNQAFQPGVHQSASAHGARFNCSKQFTAFQTMVDESGTGLSQGHDLSVSSRIGIGEVAVPSASNDLAVVNNNRADRNFSGLERALGGAESFFHEKFVGAQRVTPSNDA